LLIVAKMFKSAGCQTMAQPSPARGKPRSGPAHGPPGPCSSLIKGAAVQWANLPGLSIDHSLSYRPLLLWSRR